jgi:NAD(P)-dependent dehydrogenase (short-subunit alcohol dehydrogenase family)
VVGDVMPDIQPRLAALACTSKSKEHIMSQDQPEAIEQTLRDASSVLGSDVAGPTTTPMSNPTPLPIEEPQMTLEHKTALVTGAASGIGRAVALELAREGADVIVADRDASRGAETVAAIQSNGGTARFVAADLGDLESVANLAEEAADVDVLVNNAGTWALLPTTEQDVASFDSMFDVNVRGTFFLTSALAPKMGANGGGSIVNITSFAAELGVPGAAAYGATKAAVAELTRTWAAEFAADNIRVNAVSPGPTATEGLIKTVGSNGVLQQGAAVPLKRAASVEEIARVVAFAASPQASYVTGAVIPADGGRAAV